MTPHEIEGMRNLWQSVAVMALAFVTGGAASIVAARRKIVEAAA